MIRTSLLCTLFLFLAVSVGGLANPPKPKVTGAFEELVYENGNTYGLKIIVYQVYGAHFVLFHDPDAATPFTAPAAIHGNLIEFEIPSDLEPSSPPRKFKGKIGTKFLVGSFFESKSIKLKRCPL